MTFEGNDRFSPSAWLSSYPIISSRSLLRVRDTSRKVELPFKCERRGGKNVWKGTRENCSLLVSNVLFYFSFLSLSRRRMMEDGGESKRKLFVSIRLDVYVYIYTHMSIRIYTYTPRIHTHTHTHVTHVYSRVKKVVLSLCDLSASYFVCIIA